MKKLLAISAVFLLSIMPCSADSDPFESIADSNVGVGLAIVAVLFVLAQRK